MAQATNSLPQVVIWATGENTQDRHRQSAIEAIITSSSLNGTNAGVALNGGDGKVVELELIPSSGGGFNVEGSIGNKTSVTHVQPGVNLLISSRGSDGEDGGNGGNGKPGERGQDGQDATQYSDATPGGNGGRGGDGGLGSNGGKGGNGGRVSIVTTEENMHLVLAVDWDVRRGKGGKAGSHGLPGRGGSGGCGGSGFKWQEPTGYECKCVTHNSTAVTSQGPTLVKARNRAAMGPLEVGRDLAFSFPSGTISDGTNVAQVGNLQGMIPASIAPQFQRALMGPGSETDASDSVTSGGHLANYSHVPGCRQIATYTTRHKIGALDGSQGPSGSTLNQQLLPGRDGLDGTGAIILRNDDGSVSRYGSKFEFQLLDFEVVDENGDGIFEPGECAIVKNIRIKNSGGMPTPRKTPIPLRIQPSSWLKPVPGKDVVYLPFDIPPGGTKRITQEIWAVIKLPSAPPNSTAFEAFSSIKLRSIIPDLDRSLPHFESSQKIIIQYPVKLVTDEIKWMDTIPQGSSTSFQWVVMNISSKDLGCNSKSQRSIVTKISCPSTASAILGDKQQPIMGPKHTCSSHDLEILQQNMSNLVSEKLCVPKDALEYSTTEFLIDLLLTPASAKQSKRSPNLISIQTCKLSVQVSKTYLYNANSDFLLLTSKSTTKETVDSWSKFIKTHLHMSVDEWNISLYGGLEMEETRKSVLESYVNKTILALDDDLFQYFDQGQRSILDFIDPHEGSVLSLKGTRVVSVQRKAEERHRREGKNIEHVAHAAVLKSSHLAANELHQFANTNQLISHLHKLREIPSGAAPTEQYFVPFRGKGGKIAKKLTKAFPLDNFVVTDSADGHGVRVVHCGAHGQGYSTAQVAQTSNGVSRNEDFSGLNPGEAYSCVAALPLKVRLDILLASQKETGTFRYSEFVQNAALSSVKAELYDQVQAMAKHSRWRDGLFGASTNVSTKSLFDSANDNITAVLEHEMMRNAGTYVDDISSPAGQILRSIIQSAQCQTNGQLLMKWISPFKRTRSHIRKSLMRNVQDVIASSGQNSDQNFYVPEERVKIFKRSVSQRLVRKNYQADINSGVQNITYDAIRDVKQSLTSIEEVMPQSVYKSANELSTNRKSYEKAAIQRRRDRLQHREWKGELGLNMIESAPVGMGSAADPKRNSVITSTSISAFTRSTLSNCNETSTIITLPEMEVRYPSKVGTLHELHRNASEVECPPTPQVVLNPAGSSNFTDFKSQPVTPQSMINTADITNPSGLDSFADIAHPKAKYTRMPKLTEVKPLSLTTESIVNTASFPKLGESTNVRHENQNDALFELPGNSPQTPTQLAVLYNSQVTGDDMGDELIWLEYDEDELRIS